MDWVNPSKVSLNFTAHLPSDDQTKLQNILKDLVEFS